MNPRKILGVDENATQAEIQQAYRRQAQKHHPDMGGDAWAFQQVQEAYQSLTKKVPVTESKANRAASPPPNSSSNQPTAASRKPNPLPQSKVEDNARKWWQFFVGELPLQNETTTFILINCLDIFMTYLLLQRGAIEANPIANTFYQIWNFNGMIFFKLVVVAVVCVIAQVIAWKKLKTAKYLLTTGSFLVGAVVIYSIWLYLTKIY